GAINSVAKVTPKIRPRYLLRSPVSMRSAIQFMAPPASVNLSAFLIPPRSERAEGTLFRRARALACFRSAFRRRPWGLLQTQRGQTELGNMLRQERGIIPAVLLFADQHGDDGLGQPVKEALANNAEANQPALGVRHAGHQLAQNSRQDLGHGANHLTD